MLLLFNIYIYNVDFQIIFFTFRLRPYKCQKQTSAKKVVGKPSLNAIENIFTCARKRHQLNDDSLVTVNPQISPRGLICIRKFLHGG